MLSLPKKYNIIREIGCGSYCHVYKCYDTIEKKYVAVKKYKNKYNYDLALEEASINLKLNKHKIPSIEYLGLIYDKNDDLYTILEYMNSDLHNLIRQDKIFTFDELRITAKNILLTIDFLRKNNMIHADIKPENILVDERNFYPCLIDFSNCVKISQKASNGHMQTLPYRAPEIIYKKQFDEKIDIWSLGCTLYEMIMKTRLFSIDRDTNDNMNNEQKHNIKNFNLNLTINKLKQKIKNYMTDQQQILILNFITHSLSVDAKNRYNIYESLRDPFIDYKTKNRSSTPNTMKYNANYNANYTRLDPNKHIIWNGDFRK